jgi:shikimate dehydrogenase
MNIDGTTKVVGVFGSPVAHTASPVMQNAAFAALGMNWVYVAYRVEPQNLRPALIGARDMGLTGVNLTLPHKILAVDVVDEVHSEARKLGSVNTVLMEHGKLRGFNTDGYGFAKAIEEEFNFTLEGKRVLILGAGGAGRAIAVKCALEGAALLCVANRTVERIEPIAKEVATTKTAFRALKLNSKEIVRHMDEIDLLVNATSVGLKAGESLGLEPGLFSPKLFVYDTIYRPAETELLRVAAEAGAKVANGASMLVHQGAKSFEIWTKRKAPVAVMRRALKAAIGEEKH